MKTNYINSFERKEFQKNRPLIENVINWFKKFKIFSSPFRYPKENHILYMNRLSIFIFI